ncbi:dienelactone hydrolase family protein [Dermatophilaceae bacterium Sec6.4]
MSDILLLHSALGLRPAVTQFADLLRAGGHTVYTPDFYHGIVFEDSAQGLAHRDEVGARELFARVRVGLSQAPDNAVLAGFSLGAAFAQRLAGDRPKARAVVLMHSVAAPRGGWSGQPVQLHRYETDPFIDEADVQTLGAAVRASGASFQDIVVAGRGHLFTDLDSPDGDRRARDASAQHILELLDRAPV